MSFYEPGSLLTSKVKTIYFSEADTLIALYDNDLLIKTLNRIESDRSKFLPLGPRESAAYAHEYRKPYRHLVDCCVLWSLYSCYRVIVWGLSLSLDDKHILANVVLAEASRYTESYGFSEEQKEEFITSWETVAQKKDMTDMCWTALDLMLHTIIDDPDGDPLCWQNIAIDPDMHRIDIFPILSDGYRAMCYQLILHIQNGEEGLDGKARVICPGCGKEFIRGSARIHFCDECRKLTNRVARSRAKKEAEKDGQH